MFTALGDEFACNSTTKCQAITISDPLDLYATATGLIVGKDALPQQYALPFSLNQNPPSQNAIYYQLEIAA